MHENHEGELRRFTYRELMLLTNGVLICKENNDNVAAARWAFCLMQ